MAQVPSTGQITRMAYHGRQQMSIRVSSSSRLDQESVSIFQVCFFSPLHSRVRWTFTAHQGQYVCFPYLWQGPHGVKKRSLLVSHKSLRQESVCSSQKLSGYSSGTYIPRVPQKTICSFLQAQFTKSVQTN